MSRSRCLSILVLNAFVVLACGWMVAQKAGIADGTLSHSGPTGDPAIAGASGEAQEMLQLIPQPLPLGAVEQEPASFYTADNLYQYMDGGADIFLVYGVRQLMHLDLRVQKVELELDIFDMGTAEAAFGMYAAERSASQNYIAIGGEGYKGKGVLRFFQDRYYVKLTGLDEGVDDSLEPLARAFSAKIGGSAAFPALLGRLPGENRKPHSEQYMPNEPLGHSFLAPAYIAGFMIGEQETKLYVTCARDEADAQKRLKQLEQHFAKTGKSSFAPEAGEGAIRAGNSYEGTMLAVASGRYLLLLVDPPATSGAEELLKKAAQMLRK